MAVSGAIEMAGIELAVVAIIATARVGPASIVEPTWRKPQRLTVAGDGARVTSTGDSHLHTILTESGLIDGQLITAPITPAGR